MRRTSGPASNYPGGVINTVRLQFLSKRVLEPDAYGGTLGQQLLRARQRH